MLLPQLAGLVGYLFTYISIPVWYADLVKPAFVPPSWLFGPAWTILYVLMGAASYMVWRVGSRRIKVRNALSLYGVQLALNVTWSYLFFKLHNPLYALVEIIVLWAVIAVTTWKFYEVERKAATLMVPYLLWVTFAAMLNYYIYVLN